MAELEKIKKYIENTNFSYQVKTYNMRVNEWEKMANIASYTPYDAISLAFDYGQAKGYRMAKAEMKRKEGVRA